MEVEEFECWLALA